MTSVERAKANAKKSADEIAAEALEALLTGLAWERVGGKLPPDGNLLRKIEKSV